jgi:CHAT domain-containing protein/tetratricopeptide (TPR) repeat protein
MLLATVNRLAELGRYDEALALITQVSDAVRSTSGERSLPYASMVQKVADLNRLKGDLPAAEAAYRQAADILQETAGPDHPLLGEVLNGLGLVLRSAGQLDEAEKYLSDGTNIFKKAFGERSPYYVFALNNMAETDAMRGHLERAATTYEQVLALQRELDGQLTDSYGGRLTRLGGLYYELGRYQDATRAFEECVGLARQLYGESHMNYATSLNNLALEYKNLGELGRAEDLYRQAIDVTRVAVGEDHPFYASYISNLANLLSEKGQYREAAPLLRQALAIFEKDPGKKHPEYATALNNLGVLILAMGQTGQAETLFREALEIDRGAYGEGHPKLIEDLINLMTVLIEDQRYEEAAGYRKQADAAAAALGPRHPAQAVIMGRLGMAALALGGFTEAETYTVMAQEIWRTTTGTDDPNYADALVDMGSVARARGRFVDVENVTRRALDVYRRTATEGPRLVTALRILAGVYAATDRPADALATMQELASAGDRQISQMFSVGTEDERASAAAGLLEDVYLFASLALRDRSAVPSVFDLVLRRKGVGAEALAVQRDVILSGRYAALEPSFRELRALQVQIGQKTLAGPGPGGLEQHKALLAQWTARKEKLEQELVRQIPEMSLEQQLRAADRRAIAGALPDESALVEFVRSNVLDFNAVPERKEAYWKPARYLAFVLLAGQPEQVSMLDLGDAEVIDRQVAELRYAISGDPEDAGGRSVKADPDDTGGVSVRSGSTTLRVAVEAATRGLRPLAARPIPPALGIALRKAVLDQILPAIGTRTRLLIAPDGDLNRLPFEVLPLDGERFVIDTYRISYVGAGRDVLRFKAPATRRPAAPLVAADPDFDLRNEQGRGYEQGVPFSRLHGSREEGETVGALLKVKPMLAGGVLEQAVKASRSPGIVHIATHGFFLPDPKRNPDEEGLGAVGLGRKGGLGRLSGALNPLLRSGLALAGANAWLQDQAVPAEAQDGILSAEDVSGLDLLDTALVVLSACETGLGAVQVGEGVFGLRRAFVLAGARTLVMSLWKVPDRQTQELMEDFYRRILGGAPRDSALRAAQLAIKKKYPEPLYWGAFICQGDPGPLPLPRKRSSATRTASRNNN